MEEEYRQIKQRALSLLARREHAVAELRQKLTRASGSKDIIESVIAELIEDNYLSEKRYVEMLIRSRYGRGYGPIRVCQELRQKEVADYLIQQGFDAFEEDWFGLAREVRDKKFGLWNGGDYKERAKQMRFLASRGFSQDQIEYAFTAAD